MEGDLPAKSHWTCCRQLFTPSAPQDLFYCLFSQSSPSISLLIPPKSSASQCPPTSTFFSSQSAFLNLDRGMLSCCFCIITHYWFLFEGFFCGLLTKIVQGRGWWRNWETTGSQWCQTAREALMKELELQSVQGSSRCINTVRWPAVEKEKGKSINLERKYLVLIIIMLLVYILWY